MENDKTPLQVQLQNAQSHLSMAAATDDITLAKFALGLLAGAVIAAAPADQGYTLHGIAYHAQLETELNRVLDAASALMRRGYDYA